MTTKKKTSFEQLFRDIQNSVEELEQNKLSIDESIQNYENTMKKIKKAREMLEKMEIRINEVSDE